MTPQENKILYGLDSKMDMVINIIKEKDEKNTLDHQGFEEKIVGLEDETKKHRTIKNLLWKIGVFVVSIPSVSWATIEVYKYITK